MNVNVNVNVTKDYAATATTAHAIVNFTLTVKLEDIYRYGIPYLSRVSMVWYFVWLILLHV